MKAKSKHKDYRRYVLPTEEKDIENNFKIAKSLGKGSFGEVFHALDIKEGCECAVKIIIKSNMDHDQV